MTSTKGTATSQDLVRARGSPGHGATDLMEVREGGSEFKVILSNIVALGQLGEESHGIGGWLSGEGHLLQAGGPEARHQNPYGGR